MQGPPRGERAGSGRPKARGRPRASRRRADSAGGYCSSRRLDPLAALRAPLERQRVPRPPVVLQASLILLAADYDRIRTLEVVAVLLPDHRRPSNGTTGVELWSGKGGGPVPSR